MKHSWPLEWPSTRLLAFEGGIATSQESALGTENKENGKWDSCMKDMSHYPSREEGDERHSAV